MNLDYDSRPTQDAPDLNISTLEEKEWGQLLPMSAEFLPIDLTDDSYLFGRAKECYVSFNKGPYLSMISKEHFRIQQDSNNGRPLVFLTDLSSNGTFVNKQKVGKGQKVPLNNNDEIAVAVPHYKCYTFRVPTLIQAYPDVITNRYTVTGLLGRGACGEVRQVFERGSCQRMAMKIIEKKRFSSKFVSNVNMDIEREANILRQLKHPNIIRVQDVIDTPEKLYIVLEIVDGGELFDRVVAIGQFPEKDAKNLCYQMLLAIKYLHEKGITHRDLKPENILLTKADTNVCLLKVTDFGLSKFFDGNTILKTFCGTPSYLAPEVITTQGVGSYNQAIDVWSLGVIFFICLVGYPPFTDERADMSLSQQIVNASYSFPQEYWKDISSEAVDLIKRMMTVDPTKRITVTEALDHPWFHDSKLKEVIADLYSGENALDGMAPPASKTMPRKRPAEETNGDASNHKKAH